MVEDQESLLNLTQNVKIWSEKRVTYAQRAIENANEISQVIRIIVQLYQRHIVVVAYIVSSHLSKLILKYSRIFSEFGGVNSKVYDDASFVGSGQNNITTHKVKLCIALFVWTWTFLRRCCPVNRRHRPIHFL